VLQKLIADIIPLALLVMFFGIQQRGRRQLYYRFWFAGWICVLISYALWALANHGIALRGLVETARLDLLLVASLLFMTSFLTSIHTLRRVVLTGVPCGLLVVLLINLQQLHYDMPRAMMVAGVLVWEGYGFYAAKIMLSGKRLHRWLIQALCAVLAVALSVIVWRTGGADLSGWAQIEFFLSAAVLYGVAHQRRTPAGILATIGFTLWAMIYGWSIGSAYLHLSADASLQHMGWILPKYLVTFAMVLKIFEDAQDEKSALVVQYSNLYDDFRRIYESHPHPMWIYDRATGLFLSANTAAIDIYGYSMEELQQMRFTHLELALNDEQALVNHTAPMPEGGRRGMHGLKDGRSMWVNLYENEIVFQEKLAVKLMARDVTSTLDYNYLLLHQAQHDELTGLPNRKLLADRMKQALERSVRDDKKTAVFAIDIDHFKKVNDVHGHQIGDECLKAVADRLNSKVRSIDTLARMGGEEFMAVIGGLSNATDAEMIAHGLLRLFETPLPLQECQLTVTISIGLAVFPDDGYDAETLYKLSDGALYAAKRNGRNRVEVARAMDTPA
jgi:diguanylate cyclase (GGDEF)-like protein/PAS domain S-box-containing protein